MHRSILIINDESATRYLLRLLLENIGFAVTEANYGIDAYQKAHRCRPDLMIFDVSEPESEQFAICKPAANGTPVHALAMLTPKTHATVFKEVLQDTITHYLPKPLNCKDLAACLQQVLQEHVYCGNGRLQNAPLELDLQLSAAD